MAQNQTFGSFIRKLRQNNEQTLKEVADHMGWSVVYLSDIERDRRNPPQVKDLARLSDYLNSDLALVQNMADRQRQRVELDIDKEDGVRNDAALLLARRWTELTPEQAEQIMSIIKGKE